MDLFQDPANGTRRCEARQVVDSLYWCLSALLCLLRCLAAVAAAATRLSERCGGAPAAVAAVALGLCLCPDALAVNGTDLWQGAGDGAGSVAYVSVASVWCPPCHSGDENLQWPLRCSEDLPDWWPQLMEDGDALSGLSYPTLRRRPWWSSPNRARPAAGGSFGGAPSWRVGIRRAGCSRLVTPPF